VFTKKEGFATVWTANIGLRASRDPDTQTDRVPVVFLLALRRSKKLSFRTINGKQTRVPASLIYDLFDVTTGRSPQKPLIMARSSNSTLVARGMRAQVAWQENSSQDPMKRFRRERSYASYSITFFNQAREDFDAARTGKPIAPDPKAVLNSNFVTGEDDAMYAFLTISLPPARSLATDGRIRRNPS